MRLYPNRVTDNKAVTTIDKNRMTDIKRKLYALVQKGESAEVEFKSARGGFPGSFWESYSAFANTNGGTIILGVQEKDGKFLFDGLSEEATLKYKKNFWDNAHNRGKVSVCLPHEQDVEVKEVDGAYLLVCHIPRAEYNMRPVYLTTNPIGNTYRRNHEGDYLCTDAEVRRKFADAEHESHPQDAIIRKGFTLENAIDLPSLHQYRQLFVSLHPTHPWAKITDDLQFMEKIGAYSNNVATGESGITRAGLLIFGQSDMITNPGGEPYYFVDYQERLFTDDSRVRWTDRIYPDGTWEANLFQFYVRVYNKLIQALPKPFKLVGDERQEETAAHDAVREALINCIVHQDLNATGNIVVRRTETELTFSNPGMMLVSKQQYFKGGRSICRNPTLQKMFMLLGKAEKAGSGVDKILAGWKELGWDAPRLTEEVQPDYVVLTLPIGKTRQENPIRKPDKNEKNPTRKTDKKEMRRQQILEYCAEPRSSSDILEMLGLKDKENLMEVYINPMIAGDLLSMTEPDNPTSRNQMYVATKAAKS